MALKILEFYLLSIIILCSGPVIPARLTVLNTSSYFFSSVSYQIYLGGFPFILKAILSSGILSDLEFPMSVLCGNITLYVYF